MFCWSGRLSSSDENHFFVVSCFHEAMKPCLTATANFHRVMKVRQTVAG
jgi:hypothetical protein